MHAGSDFVIDVEFQSTNGTGTGELALEIATADGVPLGQDSILLPEAPGSYGTKYTASAKPDPNCDPTQGPCEMWIAGNYTAKIGEYNYNYVLNDKIYSILFSGVQWRVWQWTPSQQDL